MKKIILLSFALLSLNSVKSQTTKYIYFDADWKMTTSSSNYSFYRKISYSSQGYINNPIVDYFKNGNIQCVLNADKYDITCGQGCISCGLTYGNATWYNNNGTLSQEAVYKNSKLILSKEYNDYGYLVKTTGCASGDCENGYGTYFYSEGDRYSGYFANGNRHGSGTYTWKVSGNSYSGQFKNNAIDKSQSNSYKISAQDISDGLEVAIKLVELYKSFTK